MMFPVPASMPSAVFTTTSCYLSYTVEYKMDNQSSSSETKEWEICFHQGVW